MNKKRLISSLHQEYNGKRFMSTTTRRNAYVGLNNSLFFGKIPASTEVYFCFIGPLLHACAETVFLIRLSMNIEGTHFWRIYTNNNYFEINIIINNHIIINNYIIINIIIKNLSNYIL